ncbi:LacI family DNA-binding transcriptional regulator [Marinobacterium rhizophilum]|uniref:LacI family DNA-binding transcriptional regulator n=1 Tax=Marinobacterium rhizophilum TaxID=420402 RepID=A0ABY5HLL4_9GAMM|nr:LacI family DNA-binding transcriptional regulator [Marinobacterium rhizophilum]UTW12125.1 LacI family DNA-binding transcriptional regulator [Marinobacterium rhizophilum]
MSKKVKNMEEFSRIAGVSRPTASKYFESPDAVTPRSRQKIEAALEKIDYRPNFLASNLMRKETRILGVLVPSIGDPFYAEIVRAIEVAALKYGYMAMIECSYGSGEMEEKAIENFMSVNVAGICIAPVGLLSSSKVLSKTEKSIPVVYIDSTFDESDAFVKTNNAQSIGLITQYMLRASEQPPMLFPMPNVNSNAQERSAAYVATMDKFGFEPILLDVNTDQKTWDFEKWGQQEMLRLLDRGGIPGRSILCANDRIAFGVISALYGSGLEVGRKTKAGFSVAGHDNQPLSNFTCPPLTTVAQDFELIGSTAIEILLQKIGRISRENLSNKIMLDTQLILRESA